MTESSAPGSAEAGPEPQSRPTFDQMPAEGKIAVMLLRAQAVLGMLCCTGLGFETMMGFAKGGDPSEQLQANASEPVAAQLFTVGFVAWIFGAGAFRILIAGQLIARRRWARTALIAFASADVALGVGAWLLLAAVTRDATLVAAVVVSSLVGVLTAAVLLVLARTRELTAWCDRPRGRVAGATADSADRQR